LQQGFFRYCFHIDGSGALAGSDFAHGNNGYTGLAREIHEGLCQRLRWNIEGDFRDQVGRAG